MPLKLNVGLSQKIGQPDYGSLGASCHMEVELDHALLTSDLEGVQQRVRQAFNACRQAVNDELARHAGDETASAESSSPAGMNGKQHGQGTSNVHRASRKQLDYARQLAGQITGLGVRRLEDLSHTMFAKPLADLSSLAASGLIDMLRAIKAGRVDLAAALGGDQVNGVAV